MRPRVCRLSTVPAVSSSIATTSPTGLAVYVTSTDQPDVCGDHRDPRSTRLNNIRIFRNFIHHNQKQQAGYAVEVHGDTFALIQDNIFVSTRHGIMADGS